MPLGMFQSKNRIQKYYQITGFISSGTYGRVYKARGINGRHGEFAIKKFKPDKEGELTYTGISQSATREMALCAELTHPNVIAHVETILQDKSIYMVFSYCEHDLLQIIHFHSSSSQKRAIPAVTVRSILYQLLKGCQYLHESWVMHRDLKPANIMVTAAGQVMVGDLGLARIFKSPLISLFNGDKVVVTIWYRAPELLMGARHYTPAVDLWAVGCIFAELLWLRPIFKGEEAKMDSKKTVPFQRHQMQRIVEVMGMPTPELWPQLPQYPEYQQLSTLYADGGVKAQQSAAGLEAWYRRTLKFVGYPPDDSPGDEGFSLLQGLLTWDPEKRLTAAQALTHPYFIRDGAEKPSSDCFAGSDLEYPKRKISQDDTSTSLPGTKRSGLPDDTYQPRKRPREG